MKPESEPGWSFERRLWQRGWCPVAGVDEAGRGALAGPVVAAAVVLPFRASYPFRDSKTISAKAREDLAALVKRTALSWALGYSSAAEIDRLNVLEATRLAATRALALLDLPVRALVTDYLRLGGLPVLAPAGADRQSYQAAAASILAKTARDEFMRSCDARLPGYAFAAHKGYGSPQHLRALELHGPCELHRLSFRPLRERAAKPANRASEQRSS